MATNPKNEGIEMSPASSTTPLFPSHMRHSDDVESENGGSDGSNEAELVDGGNIENAVSENAGTENTAGTENAVTGCGDEIVQVVVDGNLASAENAGTENATRTENNATENATTENVGTENNATDTGTENTGTGDGGNQHCCRFCCPIILTDLKSVFIRGKEWFCELHDEEKWVEDRRGFLGTVAGLITTMSFAAGLAPPGGVVSVALGDSVEDAKSSTSRYIGQIGANNASNTIVNSPMPAGEAISAVTYPGAYNRFLVWNNVSLYLSFVIFLMMMSGIRLKHRFMVWLSTMLVFLDVFAAANVFTIMLSMTTPKIAGVWMRDVEIRNILINIWMGTLIGVALVMTARLIYWYVKKVTANVKAARVAAAAARLAAAGRGAAQV